MLRAPCASGTPHTLEKLESKLPVQDQSRPLDDRLFADQDVRGGRKNDPRFGTRMSGQGARWDAVAQMFDVTCRRLGLNSEARTAYEQALALARQEPEQRFLERRLAELG